MNCNSKPLGPVKPGLPSGPGSPLAPFMSFITLPVMSGLFPGLPIRPRSPDKQLWKAEGNKFRQYSHQNNEPSNI